jgi:hypothetical protein
MLVQMKQILCVFILYIHFALPYNVFLVNCLQVIIFNVKEVDTCASFFFFFFM